LQKIDLSGVAVLKNKGKKADEDDLDEENENFDKETNDYNQHTEATTTDLESLKLSTINHNDTESYGSRVGGRMTRSSKLFVAPQKILPNNKRSRSPLATNNSINESTDQVNIFSSTVIEPNKYEDI